MISRSESYKWCHLYYCGVTMVLPFYCGSPQIVTGMHTNLRGPTHVQPIQKVKVTFSASFVLVVCRLGVYNMTFLVRLSES